MMKRQTAAKLMSNRPAEETSVTDEMPEWLATSDRAVVKNLSNNSNEALSYLQSKYPDAEFKDYGGDIIARKKGETAFSRLDPSFSPFSNPIGTLKDLGRDVLDLGYDAVQAGAEIGGATLGGAAGLGAGSLPAAMAGGAAGSAAASTLKEALRKKLGVSDEVSLKNIGTDALVGGLLPGVFSVGGSAIKQGAKKIAPSLYSKATGLSTSSLSRIADKGDDIAKWNEIDAGNVLSQTKNNVDSWVSGKKKEFAEKYKNIRGGKEDVSISGVMDEINNAIQVAEEKFNRTGMAIDASYLDQLKSMRDEIFGVNAKMNQNISDAMDLDSRISNDWIDWADDAGQGVGKGRTVSSEQQDLAKKLRERLRGDINQASSGSLQNTADEYSQFVDQINFIRKNFKDPTKIQNTIEALNKGKNLSLASDFQKLDPALVNQIEQARGDLDLYRYFQPMNTSLLTEEGIKDLVAGKSPIEKLLTALGTGAGYVSGGAVGGVVGAGAGRVAGRAIASPRSVKAVAKAGKKIGKRMDGLEKLLKENPQLLYLLYGAGNASTK